MLQVEDKDGQELTKLLSKLDDPFAYQMILGLALYDMAAKEGITTMMDGVDGDLIYSLARGYPAILMREGRVMSAIKETLAMQNVGRLDSSWRTWLLLMTSACRPGPRSVSAYAHSEGIDDLCTRLRPMARERSKAVLFTYQQKTVAEYCQNYIEQPFIQYAMERYDRIAGVSGVNTVHPLLDVRLVEFAASLPWYMKTRSGHSKWILRKTLTEVPDWIRWRTDKPHLGAEFTRRWLGRNWSTIKEVTLSSKSVWQPYLEPNRMLALFEASRYDSGAGSDPFDAFALSSWLGQHNQ